MVDSEFPSDVILEKDAKYLEGDSHFIRLIGTDVNGAPQANSIGRAYRSTNIRIRNGNSMASFKTKIKFRVSPNGDNITAAGLAFFIAPVDHPIPDGSFGGNYGIFNPASAATPKVFAVVFDTQKHDADPEYKHVNINIESSVPAQSTIVDESLLRNEVTAEISYDAAGKLITVDITAGQKKLDRITYGHDLGAVLNEYVHVGISGTTAERVANHDVLSWSFESDDL